MSGVHGQDAGPDDNPYPGDTSDPGATDPEPVAATATVAAPAKVDPLAYTLIQYISSSACSSKKFVCLKLTKDAMVGFFPPERHGTEKVCSKLSQNSTDSKWHIDSCFAKAGTCPDECDCNDPSAGYELDTCSGSTLPGGGGTSTKLVKGAPPAECISTKTDVDLARWCTKYPVDKKPYTSDSEEKVASEEK